MDLNLLLDNLTNPALLFFCLGIFAAFIKSDLEIPANSSKFISLYLMFSIGFKGGQELVHSEFGGEIIWAFAIGLLSAILIPLYTFWIAKRKFGIYNAAAVAAAYGSISAVTFLTTISFLDLQGIEYDGFMVAVMASMEAPAIVMGVLLLAVFAKSSKGAPKINFSSIIKHSLSNGSVVLLVGSLFIGFMASDEQARGIEPFTTDIFKGFLAVFLLDMGLSSGKHLKVFKSNGLSAFLFAVLIPLVNGCLTALISGLFLESEGNSLLLAILVASASYIAVPAAMKLAVPKANPGLYLPMALAITFPFNITFGIPVYLGIINYF
ncbi:sodium-dependent bicarbonate transport family permease [Psychroflexus tropicus]|uniref:sodium-dependent bicarbonate transport family permease n=1 Tax=Psychroflexus tropicus TaxID=197345 RepID=UPI000476250A|nr:sodium-dependent bicarbonate transport family permease [Psychroflexus tropicus]